MAAFASTSFYTGAFSVAAFSFDVIATERHATDDDKAKKAVFDWHLRHEEDDAGQLPVAVRQAVEQGAESRTDQSFDAAIEAISGLDINSLSALQIEQIGSAVDQTNTTAAPVEAIAAHIKRRRLIAALLFSRMIH